MKDERKIAISAVKQAIERFKNMTFTEQQWDVALFGWRQKHKYHTNKTLKGWIKDSEAITLVWYLTTDKVQVFIENGVVFIL